MITTGSTGASGPGDGMLFIRSCCAAKMAAPFAIACRLVAELPSADDDEEIAAFYGLDRPQGRWDGSSLW